MKYKMLLSDIDGTLRPFSSPVIPDENAQAIHTIRSIGVKFAVSTGRSRLAISDSMLNGITPDFWLCANGAQILDAAGGEIRMNRMPVGEMNALCEFCTQRNYPLRLIFSDGGYVYSGYREYREWGVSRGELFLRDGTDQTRHRTEMPFAASALLTDTMIEEFYSQYPGSELRFPPIRGNHRDILWGDQNKAAGLETLLQVCELTAEECISAGDGENDAEILSRTGMSFCMANGSPIAMAAAKQVSLPAEEFAVAEICRQIWPEAFV